VTERRAVRDGERDLPGLLDWGDELLEATVRAEGRHGRARGGGRRRPARRGAILALTTAAILLVPGAVVATRSIWDDPGVPLAATSAVRLVDGRTGDVAWRIGGWTAGGGRVCLRTEAWRGGRRAIVASGCDAPRTAAARLTALRAGPGDLTLVAGTTAAAVRAVRVRPPAGAPVRVGTVAVPAERLRRSGLTRAARIYVAVFPRGFADATRAPRVTALDAAGETLGHTLAFSP
jgi:hypothetical protein